MKTRNFSLLHFLGKYGVLMALIALCILFSCLNENFMKVSNIMNILRQVAVTGIMAVGMSMVLITGGIDLSVGSIAGVACVSTALLLNAGIPGWGAVLLVLLVCLCIGLVNSMFITVLEVVPLITTLGMMTSLRGVAYLLTGGLPVFGFPDDLSFLGKGTVSILPVPVIIMLVAFVLGIVFMHKTRFGTYIYGVGGNEEASRLSGVHVRRIKTMVYSINAMLAGLAGIVLLARVSSGQPKAGDGYEMDVITGVVLGGVSIAGGEGKISFVVVGVIFMGVLANGMIMINVDDYTQQVVKGLALLAAVSFDQMMARQKKKQV